MNKERYNAKWERSGHRRRLLLFLLIAVTALVASGYMALVLPHRGATVIEVAIVFFFALLFGWISIGFWTSLLGFFTLMRKRERWLPSRYLHADGGDASELPPTAVVMPIFNENVAAVFQRLLAMIHALQQQGRLTPFHFFILSDTTDPDIQVDEELAWYKTCRETDTFGTLFYRHRVPNIKRKSGNIADFCRRWGSAYRYMVVLDADSVVSGRTLVRMVQLMERDSSVGILQTVPAPAGKSSLLARLQQFSAQLYGPMFAAGLHYWQLGDAQYWGHNAIIRLAPFMEHCALPRLSGHPPLGGDILSHDFVEAALMRRAGWGVWLAYDLDGSYESPPPTLIDELVRDRRWCQGNLQHLRLLFTRGLFPAHRYLFLNGAMAYISALLWLIFLSLSTVEAIAMAYFEPDYFPPGGGLFPDWPVWNPDWMLMLLVSTLIILFMPKVLSLVLALVFRRQGTLFGGWLRASLSLLAEVFISTLLAPLRMLAHSKFVVVTLLGGHIGWHSASRGDRGTSWLQALRYHGGGMLLAVVWGAIVFVVNRGFFWWLVPIMAPLALAAPISVLTSRPGLGALSRRMGLFLAPTEVAPEPELSQALAGRRPAFMDGLFGTLGGFTRAVVDPMAHCLHCSLHPRSNGRLAPRVTARLDRLVDKALRVGAAGLSQTEKRQLLDHSNHLVTLHHLVWEQPDGESASRWGIGAG